MLFVGCHTGDQVTHTWRIPPLQTQVVQIDVDPAELGRSYPHTLGLMGDPKATLGKLRVAIGRPVRDTSYADRAAGLVAAWREERASRLSSNAAPILPDRLCAEITRALPEDGILVADTGYSGIWTSTLIELNGTTQTYLRAAGSLGWSFPAALGAKCAAGKRKVICWSGDGAIYYHLTELETARRRGIGIVLVINNNSGFGQGWPNIQRQQGNTPGDVRELARFGPTNFADIARVFGLRGIRVEEPSQIAPALQEALASDETVVVDVNTDIDARAPEPWLPGAKLITGGGDMISYDLKGRTALVTGGASGIGFATARMLAGFGATVAVNYLADDPRGPEAVEKIKAGGWQGDRRPRQCR